MTSNDLPSKERARDLLMNWRRWARDCPPDPAEVYYYTECLMFMGKMTKSEMTELQLTIKGSRDVNDLFNPPKTAPVRIMTAREYADEK